MPLELLSGLRTSDPDRYLATLYAPAATRPALAALYAFNVEIARIRDLIREPFAGEFRLQWWRDAVAGESAGEAASHPVAGALLEAMAVHGLPQSAFADMIKARLFDLYDDPMPDVVALEGYCGATASVLIQLAALVLDKDAAPAASEASGHAGCAQAIVGLLRLIPIHRARGQCYVPADILAAAGMDRDRFVAGSDRAGAGRAVAAMTALAGHHLGRFTDLAKALPVSLRPAFLPLAVTPFLLDAIEKAGADALDETASIGALRRHWLMFDRARRGW